MILYMQALEKKLQESGNNEKRIHSFTPFKFEDTTKSTRQPSIALVPLTTTILLDRRAREVLLLIAPCIAIIPRVYQEEYVTAWASELYAVKWWRHPTCVSLTIAMQISCFVYTVILHVPLWLQVCCTVSTQNCPTKGIPQSIIHRLNTLVATQFS